MQNGSKGAAIRRMETHTKALPTHPAARREYQFHRQVTLQSMAQLFAMDCGAVQTAPQPTTQTPPLVA